MSRTMLAVVIGMSILPGCVTSPVDDRPSQSPPPSVDADSTLLPALDALEKRHLDRARNFERESNLADALLEWELLLLINPNQSEYHAARGKVQQQIRTLASSLLANAEQARRQGNMDHAVLLYLRVLNIDRENNPAMQALQEIDAERTKRMYINRPPRVVM